MDQPPAIIAADQSPTVAAVDLPTTVAAVDQPTDVIAVDQSLYRLVEFSELQSLAQVQYRKM